VKSHSRATPPAAVQAYQVDLLITEDIRRALDESFRLRAMPPAWVKGKTEPIQTYYVEPDACSPP
jgi:class 3 adenylate cyclase